MRWPKQRQQHSHHLASTGKHGRLRVKRFATTVLKNGSSVRAQIMLLQPSADQPMAFVLSVPIHASGKCALAVDGQAHVRTVRPPQGTNRVIGPLPHVTLRQSGAFSEHIELLRHQEHRVRCKHVAHTGILWATTESSTTSRPQGQAKNTNAHRNTHGYSVKGTYIECFEHVEKEESVLRMPQMPTSAQQWVTKKSPPRISGSPTQPKRRHDKGLYNTHQRQVLKPCVGQVNKITERLSDRVDERQDRKIVRIQQRTSGYSVF